MIRRSLPTGLASLVDRLWPRGVKKADGIWTHGSRRRPAIIAANGLAMIRQSGADFRRRYFIELAHRPTA